MTINTEEPLGPRGWFRWLHDASAGRYALRGKPPSENSGIDWAAADADLVARRSWEAGFDARLDLIEKFWDALTPVQRAAAVAGASENKGCEEWIAARLSGCELGAAATCELACNALLWNQGDGQGGYWTTFLNAVGGDVTKLRRYEALGLDSRLSAEEFLSLVQGGFYDKLLYLLSDAPGPAKARVLFRVRRRDPSFGEDGPMALLPQDDRVTDAEGFDPGPQKPLVLADGSALFVDLAAIAGPGHSHGPCLEGHFWHLAGKPAMRRRGQRTIMTQLDSRWEMAKRPQNIYQLKELLPVIRRIGGRDIRLGCMLGNLSFLVRDEKLAGLIGEWEDSSDFKKIAEEASGRLRIRGGHEAEINDMVERLDDSKSLGVIQRPFCGAGGKEQMKATP